METVSGLVAELKIHVEKFDGSTGKSEVQTKESLSPIFFWGACGFQLNQFADSKKDRWSNQLVIREEDLLAKSRQQCYHPIETA
jgi:hypothetical protein